MKYLLLFFVCLCFSARADWYVATNGNNAGAGTIGDPWRDIRYGVINMSAGETLFIRGGTYNDDGFVIEEFKSGPSTNQPTIIQSYPGEWAVYFPQTIGNTNTQSGSGPHGMLIQSVSNIVLSSFEINALNCWADAVKLTGDTNLHHITLTNLTIRNSALGHGVLTSGQPDDGQRLYGLITHCTILTNGWAATSGGPFHQIYLQHSDVIVQSNYIAGITNALGGGYGVHTFTTATNIVYRNNFFTNCPAGAMGLLGSSSRDCDIYNNIGVDCSLFLDIRNSTNVRLLNNSGHGNGGGISVFQSTNVWVENNISEGSPTASTAGIYLESSSNIFVTHNLTATNHVDFTIFKTLALTTNNNLFQKVRYVDNAGDGETFTNATTYVTKFASTSTGDLHVLSGSDAIGRGKTESVFNTDFGGNVRTLPWTIGAWQFLSTNSVNIITARIGTGIILGP